MLERISGLRPEVWLSVGAGFSREDVKALLLTQGRGFVGDAVLSLEEICRKICGIQKETILNSFSRQEVLRLLLAETRIIETLDKMPALTQIKRQKKFLARLDSAFQAARLAFAHDEEESVYHERLAQILGENALRDELRALSKAYEAWLKASGFCDPPLLIKNATQILSGGWPARLTKPLEIWSLSVQSPESLEREFWEVLSQSVQVSHIKNFSKIFSESFKSPFSDQNPPRVSWQQWHTLDDAAEHLAEVIASRSFVGDQGGSVFSQLGILMPDLPVVRRSLNRALEAYGIPLADSRDPSRLRLNEALKWALLPLEVAASQFERQVVTAWLKQLPVNFCSEIEEINARGIRRGLRHYYGGVLTELHTRLQELSNELGGRKTCKEAATSHLKLLQTECFGVETESSEANESRRRLIETKWLIPFLETVWEGLHQDLERVGQSHRKAPLLFWTDKLRTRLSEVSPPVERLKSRNGVQVYRLQQAPVEPVSQLWIFGVPSGWLEGESVGNYWLTDREREILSAEFAVRGSAQVCDERLGVLQSWVSGAQEVVFLDAEYGVAGRENSSILPVIKAVVGPDLALDLPESMGAHPRFASSYGAVTRSQIKHVQLEPLQPSLGRSVPEVSATALDRYSRCSFQALGYQRWRLSDVREPDTELWPDARGNLLHEAVRVLMKTRDPKGAFQLSSEEALQYAWLKKPPRGLIKSQRVEDYVKTKLERILDAFCEKEKEYVLRSGTFPISLDDFRLRLDYPEVSIIGTPDRIDQHPDGLFVMDYKTSGTVPHGEEMIEQGYRLQLPVYALALEKRKNELGSGPVIGVQFVELDRKGARKSGIFFPSWNGKEEGALTRARANSRSLMRIEPEEAWSTLDGLVRQGALDYIQGKFEAFPRSALFGKKDQECNRCSLSDLCGYRRRTEGLT